MNGRLPIVRPANGYFLWELANSPRQLKEILDKIDYSRFRISTSNLIVTQAGVNSIGHLLLVSQDEMLQWTILQKPSTNWSARIARQCVREVARELEEKGLWLGMVPGEYHSTIRYIIEWHDHGESLEEIHAWLMTQR